jgi:hypothetical protein
MFEDDEKKGRNGDTKLAHVTVGEIVIPRNLAEDEDFRGFINEMFKKNGVDLQEFIVGTEANKVNPETGYLEFFSFKWFNPFYAFKKIIKKIIPKAPEMPEAPKPAPLPEYKAPPLPEPEAKMPDPNDLAQKNKRKKESALRAMRSGKASTSFTSREDGKLG